MARRKKGKKTSAKWVKPAASKNSGKSRSGKGIKQGTVVKGTNKLGKKYSYNDDEHKRDALTGKYIIKPGAGKSTKEKSVGKSFAAGKSTVTTKEKLAQKIRDYQGTNKPQPDKSGLKSALNDAIQRRNNEQTNNSNSKTKNKVLPKKDNKDADKVSQKPEGEAKPEGRNKRTKTTQQVREERVAGYVGKETDEGFMPSNEKLNQPKANKFEAGLNSKTRDTLDELITSEELDPTLQKTLMASFKNYQDETEQAVIAQFLMTDQPTKTQQKLADKVRKKLLSGETEKLLTEKQMISAKNTMIKHFEKGKLKGDKYDSLTLTEAIVKSSQKAEKEAKVKETKKVAKKSLDERLKKIEKFVKELDNPEAVAKVKAIMAGKDEPESPQDTVKVGNKDKKVTKHPLATGDLETMTIEELSKAYNEIYTGKGDSEIKGRVDGFKDYISKNDSFQATEVYISASGNINIKDGRHRAKALAEMGVKDIPVVVQREVSKEQTAKNIKTIEAKKASVAREQAKKAEEAAAKAKKEEKVKKEEKAAAKAKAEKAKKEEEAKKAEKVKKEEEAKKEEEKAKKAEEAKKLAKEAKKAEEAARKKTEEAKKLAEEAAMKKAEAAKLKKEKEDKRLAEAEAKRVEEEKLVAEQKEAAKKLAEETAAKAIKEMESKELKPKGEDFEASLTNVKTDGELNEISDKIFLELSKLRDSEDPDDIARTEKLFEMADKVDDMLASGEFSQEVKKVSNKGYNPEKTIVSQRTEDVVNSLVPRVSISPANPELVARVEDINGLRERMYADEEINTNMSVVNRLGHTVDEEIMKSRVNNAKSTDGGAGGGFNGIVGYIDSLNRDLAKISPEHPLRKDLEQLRENGKAQLEFLWNESSDEWKANMLKSMVVPEARLAEMGRDTGTLSIAPADTNEMSLASENSKSPKTTKKMSTKTATQKLEDGDLLYKDKASADKVVDGYTKEVEMTYADHKYAKQTGVEPRLIKLARKIGYTLDIQEGRSPSTKGFANAATKTISITPSGLKESPEYINAIMRHELIHALQGTTGQILTNADVDGKPTAKQITPIGIDATQHLTQEEAYKAMANYLPHKWTHELEAFTSNKAQLGGEDLSAQTLATAVYREAKGLNKKTGYKTDVDWWKGVIEYGNSIDRPAYTRSVIRNAAVIYPGMKDLVDTETPRISAEKAKRATNKLTSEEQEAVSLNTDVSKPKEKFGKATKADAKKYVERINPLLDKVPVTIEAAKMEKFKSLLGTLGGETSLKNINKLMKDPNFDLNDAFELIETMKLAKSKNPSQAQMNKLIDATEENIKMALFKGLSNMEDDQKAKAISKLPIAPKDYASKTYGLLNFFI